MNQNQNNEQNNVNNNNNNNNNIINNNNINNNEQNNNNNSNNIINNEERQEYKLMNNIPETQFQFTQCKELENHEKNQLLNKTNREIVDELKNMLITQQKKFKICAENTRKMESKNIELIKINNDNAKIAKINEEKGNTLIEKTNSIYERGKNLKDTISFINDKMTGVLKPYRDNIMNNGNILFNQFNSDKFKFYEDFIKVSKKTFTIENNLLETENILNQKEKEIINRSNGHGNNNGNGIWIERPNKMKIFVSQNEMNSLLSECYDGLMNLKSMQESIDNKYELLKQKMVKGFSNNINY